MTATQTHPNDVSTEELDERCKGVVDALTDISAPQQAAVLAKLLCWLLLRNGLSREEALNQIGKQFDLLRRRSAH